MAQSVHTFMMGNNHLRYLLHLPPGYKQNGNRRWPLIFFLHGIGERGSDIELVKQHGIPLIAEQNPELPFITVSPQCPDGTLWTFELEKLTALLDHIVMTEAVDTEHIYLTGLSMGGYGTWALAIAQPDRFAAIAPICGGGDPSAVCAIRHVPTWVFHGQQDNVVLIRESRKMVDALRECGGSVRFTIYPNAGHDSWTRTYTGDRLYEWFLTHTRGEVVKNP
jgi:predicted peptidase